MWRFAKVTYVTALSATDNGKKWNSIVYKSVFLKKICNGMVEKRFGNPLHGVEKQRFIRTTYTFTIKEYALPRNEKKSHIRI